ncbi:MAG: pirin family protein [Jatrophihabitans sp.]
MRSYEIRPAAGRAVTRTDWVESWHSFSFGPHYEPGNTSFGALLAHNQDLLQPGPGYTDHPHRDTEILTWVLDGCLAHQDSAGHRELIRPGTLARLSAGSGVRHAEASALGDRPVRLVQMWLAPDRAGQAPSYSCRPVADLLGGGGLVAVASGLAEHADTAIPIRRGDATLYVARPARGNRLLLPSARYLHLFLTRGEVRVEGAGRLAAGDALRLTAGEGEALTALQDAELLVWQMGSAVAR